MARKDSTWDNQQRAERGARVQAMKESLGLTVIELAAELNRVAAQLGLPQRWTGPKVTKMGQGFQKTLVEDIVVLSTFDPEQRGLWWWAFGRDEASMKRGHDRAGKYPPPKPADAALYQSVPQRSKRKRSG
jgi:hypothetical protein